MEHAYPERTIEPSLCCTQTLPRGSRFPLRPQKARPLCSRLVDEHNHHRDHRIHNSLREHLDYRKGDVALALHAPKIVAAIIMYSLSELERRSNLDEQLHLLERECSKRRYAAGRRALCAMSVSLFFPQGFRRGLTGRSSGEGARLLLGNSGQVCWWFGTLLRVVGEVSRRADLCLGTIPKMVYVRCGHAVFGGCCVCDGIPQIWK